MKKLIAGGVILGFAHCMAVQMPEDYLSDKYYAATTQVVSTSPSTSMEWTKLAQPVKIKFNNPMDATSLTIDTAGTCTGNIQLFNNRTGQCEALTLNSIENRNSVLVVNPSADLDPNTNYVITIKGAVTDFRGVAFGADQTFPFKSGVPSGSELSVLSVTASPTTFTGGAIFITLNLSRNITNVGSSLDTGNCSAIFLLSDNNVPGDCNSLSGPPTINSNGNGNYTIVAKVGPTGSYTLAVSASAVDIYGIQLGTRFTKTLP